MTRCAAKPNWKNTPGRQFLERECSLARSNPKVGLWEWDLATRRLSLSDEIYHILDILPQPPRTAPGEKFFLNKIHPADRRFARREILKSLETGRLCDIELRVNGASGSLRYCRAIVQVEYGSSHQPARLLGSLQDIGASAVSGLTTNIFSHSNTSFFEEIARHLVETLHVHSCLIGEVTPRDATIINVIAFCATGKIMQPFHYKFRGTPSEAVIQNGFLIIPANLPAHYPPDALPGQSGMESYMGKALHDKEGEVIGVVALLDTNPLKEIGQAKATLAACTNRISAELVRRKDENCLIAAREKAERATALKDKFVTMVAHDLRSPIGAIAGILALLERDEENRLSERQSHMVGVARESSKQLLVMISELLDINRLRTGEIIPALNFFNASKLIARSINLHQQRAEQKGVRLQSNYPEQKRIYVDGSLFGEVINNLISNAIKFCRLGDCITIYDPDPTGSAIAVHDTGVGMNDSLCTNLFTMEQPTSRRGTAGEKGTGLGLSYAQEIMELHQGDISVSSHKDKGALFTLTLPTVHPRALVIDDDPLQRDIVKDYLLPLEIEITEAETGRQALELLNGSLHHLVIIDIGLPEMDGFALLQKIRTTVKLRNAPVIVITADTCVEARHKAFELGANDFLTKPLSYEDVVPRVKRLIESSSLIC